MEKYISVTDLSDKIKKLNNDDWYLEGLVGTDELYELVRTLPAADVVEARHARWEDCSNGWMCSACSHDSTYDTPYCPHCGAKMDGGANNG